VKSSNFTWLAGLRFVLQYLKEGWGFEIYLCSTGLFWGSSCSATFVREIPFRGLWILNILPCLTWCIWRERNDRNFEDHERTLVELNALFFTTLSFFGPLPQILVLRTFMYS
jgi:hypothetical protein